MPLTPFQEGVLKLLSENRSIESYLAGGAARHIEPNSLRYSNDLDYVHDSEERVAEAFLTDRETLAAAGSTVDLLLSQPGYIRAIGCLDDSLSRQEFVGRFESSEAGRDIRVHYGRTGGVIPVIR